MKTRFNYLNTISHLAYNANWQEIVSFLIKRPLLQLKNSKNMSNEGAIDKNLSNYHRYKNSNKFFKKAIKYVPLASQIFSKAIFNGQKEQHHYLLKELMAQM